MSLLPLSTNSLDQISQTIAIHREALLERKAVDGVVKRYFNGKHRAVFELQAYPNHIIKLTGIPSESDREMVETIQKCRLVVEDKQLKRCFIPTVQLVEASERAFFVEEKLEGIYDAYQARDLSEQQFQEFEVNPALKAQWIEMFVQAAELIVATGYYDVDWRNVLLMEGGLGFIDFEKIDGEVGSVASGVFRLLQIAPLEAIDPILEIAKKNCLENKLFQFCCYEPDFLDRGYTRASSYEDSVSILKAARQETLACRATVSQYHKEKNINDPNALIDTFSFPEHSLERLIIEHCNKALTNRYRYSSSLIEERTIGWQPFLSSNFKESQEAFEQSLSDLKEDKVIGNWRKLRGEREMADGWKYDQYFIYI
jgi:hypothetical protein